MLVITGEFLNHVRDMKPAVFFSSGGPLTERKNDRGDILKCYKR